MRTPVFVFGMLLVIGMIGAIESLAAEQPYAKSNTKAEKSLSITSPSFKNNQMIPKKFTCDGENISPPLKFKNIPKDAKSLALIVDDPDAPKGTFNHWVAWHISAKKTKISEGEKGKMSEGLNDLGQKGYFGPCPPSGTHRYHFKIYALDFDVDISENSKSKDLLAAIQNHTIQTAMLTGKYSRTG